MPILPGLWQLDRIHDYHCREQAITESNLTHPNLPSLQCVCCTESVATNQRATNGHRFVFYSSKVLAVERRYIKDEPGIILFEPRTLRSHISPETSTRTTLYSPPVSSVEQCLARPLTHDRKPCNSTADSLPQDLPSLLEKKLTLHTNKDPEISSTFQLQPGDVIWWHHLQRSGQIPCIGDDERGRLLEAA